MASRCVIPEFVFASGEIMSGLGRPSRPWSKQKQPLHEKNETAFMVIWFDLYKGYLMGIQYISILQAA